MAYSPNTTNLPRRRALVSFFAGIAAADYAVRAAGAALASKPGGPDADPQLLAGWREYVRAEIELNAAQDVRDLVSWNARQAYPPKPDFIETSWLNVIPSEDDGDVELWSATTDMETDRQLSDEQMAEVKTWVQKCNEINIRFGVPELETAFKTAWDRQWAAFARFVATPATSLAGLAVKTSAIFYFEDQTRRAWRGMINEQTLEPEQQILLALRRDILRIASLPDDFAMEY